MFAKSISEHPPADQAALQIWTRKLLTLLVFFASLSALALLLHERFDGIEWLRSAYAAVQDVVRGASGIITEVGSAVMVPSVASNSPDAPSHVAVLLTDPVSADRSRSTCWL